MESGWVVAVPVAVGAAASFGGAAFLQHRATHQVRPAEPLRPHLLVDLIRLPLFRYGVMLAILGFVLQVVALRFGPLTLVQPILITGLFFYLTFATLSRGHGPDGIVLLGSLLALAGVSGFLLVAEPSGGTANFETAAAFPFGVALVGVVALCLAMAARMSTEVRVLPLAAATAVCYGVTAGLLRSLLSVPADTPGEWLSRWEIWAVLLVGPTGFLLNQNAFQTGTMGSLAVATITVGDPIVSIGVGIAWLGETLAGGAARVFAEVLLLLIMAGGIVILALRSPHVAERIRAEDRLVLERRAPGSA